jgi:serine/threonine protein kinase
MKENLYELMKAKTGKNFSENSIRSIMYQILEGISYMHKYGFFHRDLKPENILVEDDLIKIADFGLAREIRSVPPYTDYVSTRWYRAPECLLKSTTYNSQVDIWALGCIMIELYNLKAIFPGNSERDVLYKICSTIGVPDSNSPNIVLLAKKLDFKFPINITCPNLSSIIPNASPDALSIIKEMLQWDPANRPAANNLLLHPYFSKTSIEKGINITGSNDEAFNSKFTKKFGSNVTQVKPKFEDVSGVKKLSIEDELSKLLDDTQDFNDCKFFLNILVMVKLKADKKEEKKEEKISERKMETNISNIKSYNTKERINDIFDFEKDISEKEQIGSVLVKNNGKLAEKIQNYASPNKIKSYNDPLESMKYDLIIENKYKEKDKIKTNILNNSDSINPIDQVNVKDTKDSSLFGKKILINFIDRKL